MHQRARCLRGQHGTWRVWSRSVVSQTQCRSSPPASMKQASNRQLTRPCVVQQGRALIKGLAGASEGKAPEGAASYLAHVEREQGATSSTTCEECWRDAGHVTTALRCACACCPEARCLRHRAVLYAPLRSATVRGGGGLHQLDHLRGVLAGRGARDNCIQVCCAVMKPAVGVRAQCQWRIWSVSRTPTAQLPATIWARDDRAGTPTAA